LSLIETTEVSISGALWILTGVSNPMTRRLTSPAVHGKALLDIWKFTTVQLLVLWTTGLLDQNSAWGIPVSGHWLQGIGIGTSRAVDTSGQIILETASLHGVWRHGWGFCLMDGVSAHSWLLDLNQTILFWTNNRLNLFKRFPEFVLLGQLRIGGHLQTFLSGKGTRILLFHSNYIGIWISRFIRLLTCRPIFI